MTTAVRATLYGSYDTTDLVIAGPTASHTGSVDVFYRHGNLPGNILGLASCQTWSGHECDHWHVIYDHDGLDGRSDAYLRSVACHETGHTLALHHPNVNNHGWGNDNFRFECMRNGAVFPIHLGTHNVGHLNGYY
jgi:hypothetical protein